MKKTTEQKVVVSSPVGEKIVRASVNISPDGSTAEIIVVSEVGGTPTQKVFTSSVNELDDLFPLVKARNLSINDSFLEHKPKNTDEKKLKEFLVDALQPGNTFSNFRCPAIIPSVGCDNHIQFNRNNGGLAGYGHNLDWWISEAKGFKITKRSRIGSLKEYYSLLGVFIKTLVEECNFSVQNAWDFVFSQNHACGRIVLLGCPVNAATKNYLFGLWNSIASYKKIIKRIGSSDYEILNNNEAMITHMKIEDYYMKQKSCVAWIILDA